MGNKNTKEKKECPLCMDRVVKKTLKCGHSYCKICIDKWFDTCKNNIQDETCPDCRHIEESCELKDIFKGDLAFILESIRANRTRDPNSTTHLIAIFMDMNDRPLPVES